MEMIGVDNVISLNLNNLDNPNDILLKINHHYLSRSAAFIYRPER